MPINFQPYRAQETDLLTPAMNMVKLKQDQEQMGLLRDYRTMQMQQMEQQKQQQAQENEWKEFEFHNKMTDQIMAISGNEQKARQYFQENVGNKYGFNVTGAGENWDKIRKTVYKFAVEAKKNPTPENIKAYEIVKTEALEAYPLGMKREKESLEGIDMPTQEEASKQQAGELAQTIEMLRQGKETGDISPESFAQHEAVVKPMLRGASREEFKATYPEDVTKPTLPYKIGERQKFTGKDGKTYEGTFTGLDTNNEPVFKNIVKVYEKPDAGEKEPKYTVQQKIDDARQDYNNKRRSIMDKGNVPFDFLTNMADMSKASAETKRALEENDRAYDSKVEKLTGERPLGTSKAKAEEAKAKNPVQIRTDFQKDPSMKGNTLSKEWVPYKGYKVYKNGKVAGYYY